MYKKLTKAQREAYLLDPDSCPRCGSDELKAGGADFSGTTCLRDISCRNCGTEFHEVFEMIEIGQDEEDDTNIIEINDDYILVKEFLDNFNEENLIPEDGSE